MDITADIQRFLTEELLNGRDSTALGADDDLLELGIIDSHGFVELVTFIEDRYGIQVDDADFTPENFGSMSGIERYVQRSLASV